MLYSGLPESRAARDQGWHCVRVYRGFSLLARIQRRWLILRRVQVVVAVALAAVLGLWAQWWFVVQVDLRTGLIAWAFAGAFFLYGLWQGRRVIAERDFHNGAAALPGASTLSLRSEIALLAAVIGAGIIFRLYRIGSIPPGLNHDAAWNGLYAIRITDGLAYSPYVAAAWGRETIFHYLIAGSQVLLGPTAFAVQLAAIAVGVATLVAFYFLMRRLFDTPLALVATYLLGVSGWHLTFSKVGWRAILVPLFVALVFYFLIEALRSRRRRDFALAGIFLGLSLDTYDAARMIPIMVGVFLVYRVATEPALLRRNIVGLAVLGISAVAAFSPLGWYALNHWEEFTGRAEFTWIGGQVDRAGSLEPLWTNIKNGLLLFNFRANGNDFFVDEPLLDVPVSVFFVLGLIYSLLNWRRPGHFMLLVILTLSVATGVASQPNGNRAIGAVVPAAAFAGIFIVVAWRWLQWAFPRLAPYFTLGMVGVLIFSGYITFDEYLGPNRREQWGFYPETTRVGRYVKTIADKYEVHLVAGNWPRDALTYLSYSGEGDPFQKRYTYTSNADEVLALTPSRNRGVAFIIEAVPRYEEAFNFLRAAYPTATQDQIHYGSNIVVANVLLVAAGATAASAAPADADQPEGTPAPPGADKRDAERRSELRLLAAALLEYKVENGSFPSTSNNVQSACVYEELDALCRLKPALGPEVFVDPFGDAHKYGYWYASDGESFTLYAILERAPGLDETCAGPGDLGGKRNLYCLHASE